MIEVEQYRLPLPCLSPSNTFKALSEEDINKVLKALKVEGIIAEVVQQIQFVYFKVTELL